MTTDQIFRTVRSRRGVGTFGHFSVGPLKYGGYEGPDGVDMTGEVASSAPATLEAARDVGAIQRDSGLMRR